MDRYIGLDAHASSCTVAIVGPSGRRVHSQVVETNAGALIRVLGGIPGTRHLCLEEGTHANWLYEVLSPHVEEIVVAGLSESWTACCSRSPPLRQPQPRREENRLRNPRRVRKSGCPPTA